MPGTTQFAFETEAICPKCATPTARAAQFCRKCGAALTRSGQEKRRQQSVHRKIRTNAGRRRAHQADRTRRTQIGNARSVMGWVGMLQLLGTFLLWLGLRAIQEPGAMHREFPTLSEHEIVNVLALVKMYVAGNFVLAVAFFGLYFWSRANAFAATLTGLLLYITVHLVAAALNPLTLAQGIIIKVVIIIVLLRGVQASLKRSKVRSRAIGRRRV